MTEKIQKVMDDFNLITEIRFYWRKPDATSFTDFLKSLRMPTQEKMYALLFALYENVITQLPMRFHVDWDFIMQVAHEVSGYYDSQMVLLRGLEFLCEILTPEALDDVSRLFDWFYDNALIDDDLMITWYNKCSTGPDNNLKIWKAAQPFFHFLESNPLLSPGSRPYSPVAELFA